MSANSSSSSSYNLRSGQQDVGQSIKERLVSLTVEVQDKQEDVGQSITLMDALLDFPLAVTPNPPILFYLCFLPS
jgi:phage protein D